MEGAGRPGHAKKLATYHAWMALPLKTSNVRGPPHVLPRYLELELSRHVSSEHCSFLFESSYPKS